MKIHPLLAVMAAVIFCEATWANAPGRPLLSPPPTGTRFEFGGVFGERVKADIEHWLVPAPAANPGMVEMFQVRDRRPVPQLVPWAGEFAGKYLISAIQALRMSDSKELRATVENTIAQVIAGQDEEGYLGPFRKDERLLGQWDLWGHYHIILALLMWHEEAGDTKAFECAKRMGDFICKVYLNTDRRPIQAGSTEMNLAIIHGLGKLYRATSEQRYLDMMRVVEEDWQQAGDYFRQGLADVPFFKIPSPRWESLHDMQGLGELYRITGNEDYKTAYVNLWKSIRRHDRHNTGGFSTGEQAIGNPYTPGAIETCCTTAWSAITQDILELTGDPLALDELELSLFNSILGSQHPSGRWFTYNTPMDGKREASAHTIVFQSRAGTPELNCCSVNAPRGLGMVSDWAVMSGPDNALYVHYLGPMKVALPKPDGNSVSIEVRSNYPADGKIWIQASQTGGDATPVFVQLPRWCSEIRLNGHGRPEKLLAIGLGAGASTAYAEFEIPMELRVWLGDGAQLGKASIYRGPLLLAFDQRDNPFDADALPALDFTSLLPGPFTPKGSFPPLTALSITAADKTAVALRDFATAGAAGTEYVSWLPITNAPPPDFGLQYPVLGDVLPGGPVMFKWSGDTRPEGWSYTVEIAADVDFSNVIYTGEPTPMPWHVVRASLEPGVRYFWRVRAKNGNGDTLSTSRALMDVLSVGVGQEALRVHAEKLGQAPLSLADHFTVDPAIKNDFIDNPAAYEFREDGLIVGDCLDGKAVPAYGHVDLSQGLAPAPDRHGNPQGAVAFSGKGQVRYRTPGFPGDNYALSVWFNPSVPQAHMAQVFSAWSKGGDDPLRIVIDNGKVYARIEGNAGANSKGVPVEVGKWTHVAAVKAGGSLKFFVNGALVDTTGAPGIVPTLSKDVSIGSNPHHSGDEHFTGAIDDLALYARPLSDDEVKALAAAPPKF